MYLELLGADSCGMLSVTAGLALNVPDPCASPLACTCQNASVRLDKPDMSVAAGVAAASSSYQRWTARPRAQRPPGDASCREKRKLTSLQVRQGKKKRPVFQMKLYS